MTQIMNIQEICELQVQTELMLTQQITLKAQTMGELFKAKVGILILELAIH